MNMRKKITQHKKKFDGDTKAPIQGLSAKGHVVKQKKKTKKSKPSTSIITSIKALKSNTISEDICKVLRPELIGFTKGAISGLNTVKYNTSETSNKNQQTVNHDTNVTSKLEKKRKKKVKRKINNGHSSFKTGSGNLTESTIQKIQTSNFDNMNGNTCKSTASGHSIPESNKLSEDHRNSKKLKNLKWKKKQSNKKRKRREARKTHSVETDMSKSGDRAVALVDKKEAPVSLVYKKGAPVSLVDKKGAPVIEFKKKNSIEAATANWKKLQETLRESSGSLAGKKRKIPDHALRNPKYRKKEPKEVAAEKEDQAEKEPEIWFDDVDEILLDRKAAFPVPTITAPVHDENLPSSKQPTPKNPLVKAEAYKGLTKAVGMDCEMVGVGDGTDSMLARVSIVNQYGEPVYDAYVRPKEKVVDYRTHVSGIRPQDLKNGEPFEEVQKDVSEILKGRLLVGHAIMNDLRVLYLSHPKKKIRDTSRFKKFRQLTGGKTPSLKKLSEKVLAVKVQEGEHNSIQDAQAAMRLYTMYRKEWEAEVKGKRRRGKLTKQAT